MVPIRRLSTFEIGSIYGVSPRSLRFYEEQGLLSPVIQDGGRLYTAKDRVKLELILKGKDLGFSFIELKVLILETVQQKEAHDATLEKQSLSRCIDKEHIAEEIWRIEQAIEKLNRRLLQLQSLLG